MALLVPVNWLNDYINVNTTPEELAERLTIAGLEVETVEHVGQNWDRDYIFTGKSPFSLQV